MNVKGGCYCGAIRYEANGAPALRAQCHCRECQYITGGAPNVFMLMPLGGFNYTQGQVKTFRRDDLQAPMTREFCPECGTHLLTRSPERPRVVILKVGGFDDPGLFERPDIAMFTGEQQQFHHIPEGTPSFEGRAG